ncbi:hypothetical protein [Candidatus Sororendozoicomonas aggregata]|uniref:hypothetical protein n=1 Tax=Candidatus Sororendozoicomonas aggregata TaxID=3073239 RepID=UPI002ED31289
MMFAHQVFYDKCRFQNLSGRVFTLARHPVLNCGMGAEYHLKFRIYEGSVLAGYVRVVGKPYHSDKKGQSVYHLYNIDLEKEYQSLSLGSLLLYIINTEIRLNGGDYLYANYPKPEALRFYLRLGFIPDPDEVRVMNNYLLSAPFGPDTLSSINDFLSLKIMLSETYSRWKCHTEVLNEILCEKMCEKFKFLQPA